MTSFFTPLLRITYDSKTSEGRQKYKAFKRLGMGDYDGVSRTVPLDVALHVKVNRGLSKEEYEGLRKDLKIWVDLPTYK